MLIAGVDEVGRGCLAGPVVAAAAVFPENYYHPGIKDSKKLSSKKREELFPLIMKEAAGIGLGVVCSGLVDRLNILNATKEAMHRALTSLKVPYGKLIADAVALKNISGPFIHPPKADENFIQVSAASIVAKVYRDSLMKNMAALYPPYGWETNAGYGTAFHIEALKTYGPTPLHRKTFIGKFL